MGKVRKVVYLCLAIALAVSLMMLLNMRLAGHERIVVIFDSAQSYDYAYISLPNGSMVEGRVEYWCSYDGDMLIVTVDGKTYLTHAANIALVAE